MQTQLPIVSVFLFTASVLLHIDAKSTSSYNYVLQYDKYVEQQWQLLRDPAPQPLAFLEIGFLITEANGKETIRMTLAMKSLLPDHQHLVFTGFEGPTDTLVEQLNRRNEELRTYRASPSYIKSFFQTREGENILIPQWPINKVFEIRDTRAHHFDFLLNPEYESQRFTLIINLYASRIVGLQSGFNPIEVTITLPERKASPVAQRTEETDVQQANFTEETAAEVSPAAPAATAETTISQREEIMAIEESRRQEPVVHQEPRPRARASGEERQLELLLGNATDLYHFVFKLSGSDELLKISKATLDSSRAVINQVKTEFDRLRPKANTADFTTQKDLEDFDDYYSYIIATLGTLETRLAEQTSTQPVAHVDNRQFGEKIIEPVERFVAGNTELFISAGLLVASLFFILFVSLKKTKEKPQPMAEQAKKKTRPRKEGKKKEKSHYELKKEMYLSGRQSDTIKI